MVVGWEVHGNIRPQAHVLKQAWLPPIQALLQLGEETSSVSDVLLE